MDYDLQQGSADVAPSLRDRSRHVLVTALYVCARGLGMSASPLWWVGYDLREYECCGQGYALRECESLIS